MRNAGCADDASSKREGLPGRPNSIWLETTQKTDYPTFSGEQEAETVVVGGGIAGLTTAFLLTLAGQKVVVLESKQIAGGVTGHTTGKLTSLHTLIYDYLINSFGKDKALVYGQANELAIRQAAEWISEYKIDCDFELMPAYTYAAEEAAMPEIRTEYEAAKFLGLPAVLMEDDVPLPFPVAGAVRFDNQARFHPRKFLLGLTEIIRQNGGQIFENSPVTKVSEGQVELKNSKIKAKNIVISSHFPIYDPLKFFARMKPRRSLVLGLLLNQPMISGMFISNEDNFHSLRPHPYKGEEMLLVGGELYRMGEDRDVAGRFKNLEKWARSNLDVKSIELHWATHDQEPFDRVPFIGRFSDGVFGATGFKGWGMTHGIVAGMLISDLILGRENPWVDLYDPRRPQLARAPKETISNIARVGKDFVRGKVGPEADGFADIKPDHGQVKKVNGKETAVYRDEQGELHAVSASCSHLGCTVGWNNAEKSWDCPCHGSRFDCCGKVINSPAIKNLSKVEIQKDTKN